MVFSLTQLNNKYQANNFGLNISVGNVSSKALNGRQLGVPQPQLACLNVIPAYGTNTSVAINVTALAVAGYVPFSNIGSAITVVPGIYNVFTNTTDTVYYFDVPRNVTINIATGAITTTFTVWGFDEDDVFMTETITCTTAGGVSVNQSGNKAFAGITKVYASNGTGDGGAITITGGSRIGLPYVLDDASRIFVGNYSNGNTIGVLAGYVVASTIPATATTGDIRGTANLTGVDGVKRLVVGWVMAALPAEVNAENYATVYGVPQYRIPYI